MSQSGSATITPLYSIQLAKPSFSHRSSHHLIVTGEQTRFKYLGEKLNNKIQIIWILILSKRNCRSEQRLKGIEIIQNKEIDTENTEYRKHIEIQSIERYKLQILNLLEIFQLEIFLIFNQKYYRYSSLGNYQEAEKHARQAAHMNALQIKLQVM